MTKSIYNKQNGRFEDEEANAGGSGTVTSVGVSVPSIFSIFGSPITSSGTMILSLASQAANRFFAAPNGSAGLPTFRAIATADLPTGALPMLTLLDSVTVSGAAVTSVQFAGLTTLAQGERWLIEASIYNPTASTSTYYLEYNSDTTLTNYHSQSLTGSGASAGATPFATPRIAICEAGGDFMLEVKISRDRTGRTFALSGATREVSGAAAVLFHSHIYELTTDPTSIEIVGSVASSVGIGSIFKLYKVLGA